MSISGQIKRLAGIGRRTVPRWEEEARVIADSGLFDRNYYLESYPDVAGSGIDPIEHYVRHGAKEGRDPSALFDTRHYLASSADVEDSGVNPLYHYVTTGRSEGRTPRRKDDPVRLDDEPAPDAVKMECQSNLACARGASDLEILRQSGLFDAGYYLRAHPELAACGVDPIAHYLEIGARKGYRPAEHFDSTFYLNRYRDVARSGMNPLRHYCLYGWRELRSPSASVDAMWYWIVHMSLSGDTSVLAHLTQRQTSDGIRLAPSSPMSRSEKHEIAAAVHQAILEERLEAGRYRTLGGYLEKNAVWDAMEEVFRKAVETDPSDVESFRDLAKALDKQGKFWLKAEILSGAVRRHPDVDWLQFQLGLALEKMNRHVEAAAAYATAAKLRPRSMEYHYRLGLSLERSGERRMAEEAYRQACDLDPSGRPKRLGIGLIHEGKGLWVEAAEAYRAKLQEAPLDAVVHFKYGMALDRCYEWELALASYRNAIGLSVDLGTPHWHYRLGYVLERLQRYEEASRSYRWALENSEALNKHWLYRLGYVLSAAGSKKEACEAFSRIGAPSEAAPVAGVPDLESRYAAEFNSLTVEYLRNLLEADFQDAKKHHALGQKLESLGDLVGAVKAYSRALDRSDNHMPAWHLALGSVLYKQRRYAEACDAFVGYETLHRPYGVPTPDAKKEPALRASMEYCEYSETSPLRDKVIVYDSYNGSSVSGNPYAIFKRLLNDGRFSDWLHVWSVKDRALIPDQYRSSKNVVFVRRDSHAYRKYLATASHLVSNTTLPPWFIRRPRQKYLNTWHGTPLKTLGRDMHGRFLEHKTFTRNLLHATHVISPNPHTTRVVLDRHEIKGNCPPMVAETGYPRVDLMLNISERRRREIRSRLGVDDGKRVVLYAPTWRGVHGAIDFDVTKLEQDLAVLRRTGVHVLFRGHALVESIVSGLPGDLVVPADIDTNELLGIVDLLITDYSSIFFDFIPAKKPIIFYAYDEDRYVAERGMYFDLESMPGVVCRTVNEVSAAVEASLHDEWSVGSSALAAAETFCPREDGAATERVVSFFFDDDQTFVVNEPEPEKYSILAYAGDFVSNGITSSFLNLARMLEQMGVQLTVALDHANVAAQDGRIEKLEQLPASVQRIARFGAMVLDPEEKWIVDAFNRGFNLPTGRMWEIYQRAFNREFRRVFGYLRFDAHVQFEGFLRFWASLLAAGTDQVRRSIFMHSDMHAEYLTRFPHVEAVFNLYRNYDSVVSVSETMAKINSLKIAPRFQVPDDRFVYCQNAVDAEGIRAKADAGIDDDLHPWFAGARTFVSIGRLSPEKDHSKLIRAFRGVRSMYEDAKLVIVGDGPLAYDLRVLVEELSLGSAVCIAGARSNPYPLLKASNCFVLSSNHEGQPMVLLEAMVLGKPIVATDIDGNRSTLGANGGLLVENSERGLEEGMKAAIAGAVRASSFHESNYRSDVVSQFSAIAGID